MFEESFSLVVDDIDAIKELLDRGEPTQVNINDELYVVLAIDDANSELQLEHVEHPPTYH